MHACVKRIGNPLFAAKNWGQQQIHSRGTWLDAAVLKSAKKPLFVAVVEMIYKL
jgi:hypothetical protein